MSKLFTSNQIKTITDLYLSGRQQWEIAKIMTCSQVTISNILRQQKVPTRVGKNLIYTDLNINFFKEINCEANAYFLGFLYADGCVQISNNAYQMTLKLKSNDLFILEKFRDFYLLLYLSKLLMVDCIHIFALDKKSSAINLLLLAACPINLSYYNSQPQNKCHLIY